MRDTIAIDTTADEATCTVTVSGELDVASATELTAELERVLESDPREVVVDLAGVTFIDSSGLRVLVHLASSLRAREATLRIDGMSATVRRTFEIAGLIEDLRAG